MNIATSVPYRRISVVPTEAPLGAEIRGVDLSQSLDDETFSEIERAYAEREVIFFRNQKITPEQHVAFARRFGSLEIHNVQQFALKSCPEVLVLSNIKDGDGNFTGLADAGRTWHTDMSWSERPPRGSLLYALEVPHRNGESLGDTLFASARAAYDSLPDAMKARVADLRAVHQLSSRKRVQDERSRPKEATYGQPDVVHPVARTHPVTGKKCLYVNSGECTGIVGMPDEVALPLIEELEATVLQSQFIYRHKWRPGDLVIWDNCYCQHLAIQDYNLDDRRLMHRVTVNGTPTF
jgi:taurine dioxygenase